MIKISSKMLKKLKWGVAGCGRFAENRFLPVLTKMPKNKVVSLYSSNLNRAKSLGEKFGIPNYFNNYEELLNSDIDCVYIASANKDHYSQVIEAAKAGKNILCEKPLAMNSQEAAEMVKVCNEHNVMLAVNYVHRYHPLTQKAKEIINKGMLGKIVSISANFNMDYAPNDNFRFKKDLSGGGALRDIGTHMIDLLRFLGGEITDIQGVIDNIIYKSEVEDFAAAILKFEKSGYGFFNVSFNVKKPFNRIEILGYNGSMIIDNLIGRRRSSVRLLIDINGESTKAFTKRANKQIYALKAVQKSFTSNQKLFVDGNEGLLNLKIMEKLEAQCLKEANL